MRAFSIPQPLTLFRRFFASFPRFSLVFSTFQSIFLSYIKNSTTLIYKKYNERPKIKITDEHGSKIA